MLVAPSAVTHANDMSQRVVPLAIEAEHPGGVTVKSPPSANVAPPGWYMLFVLDDGVPSVAAWVRLDGEAPAPPVVPPDPPKDPEPEPDTDTDTESGSEPEPEPGGERVPRPTRPPPTTEPGLRFSSRSPARVARQAAPQRQAAASR